MRYAEIMEAALPDPRTLGEVTSGPDVYLHVTDSDASLRSILAGGLDLKRFGATVKRTRQPDLARFDPKGVYATAHEPGYEPKDRPWVIFRLEPIPVVLGRPEANDAGYSALRKEDLHDAYGATGAALTKLLLRGGIQVVHSAFEFIVLDPARIKIIGSSIGR